VQEGASALAGGEYTWIPPISMEGYWYVRPPCLFPSIHRNPGEEEYEDDTMDDGSQSWLGNRRRKLWKSSCTHAALNVSLFYLLSSSINPFAQPSLPTPERALYAALAPSPRTAAVLKSACRTWEDHLWAQISIICEEKESAEIFKLGGGFWEQGLAAVRKGVHDSLLSDAEDDWEKEVMGDLENLKDVSVQDGRVSFIFRLYHQTHCDAPARRQTMYSTSPSYRLSLTVQAPC
jgi:hypothetical protein